MIKELLSERIIIMSENNFNIEQVEGAEKELKSKDNTRKIIGIIALIAFIVSAGFLVTELPKYISRKNYEKAVQFEQEYDYESAVDYYSKVKESDSANFSAANSKIAELNGLIEKNKFVASAVNAAINTKYISIESFDEVKDVMFSNDGNDVAFVVNGTGYIVSTYEPDENRYYTTLRDTTVDGGLYVTKYAPSATFKGWLGNLTEEIKTESSNILFKAKIERDFNNDGYVPKLAEKYVKLTAPAEQTAQAQ